MADIVVSATDKDNPYGSQASVTIEEYSECSLFFKYEHKPHHPLPMGTLRVFKQYYKKWYNSFEYFFTGKTSDPYVSIIPVSKPVKDMFLSAHVYFSKYHKEEPLLLRFNLIGEQSRYYTKSMLEYDLKHTKERLLITLSHYTDEKSLLKELLELNDLVNKTVTYQVENRQRYNNVYLTEVVGYPKSGFTKYEHRSSGQSTNRSSFVLFNGQTLQTISTKKNDGKFDLVEIDGIQNKRYLGIDVYFGTHVSFPLLLTFTRHGLAREYFSLERNIEDDKLFWKRVSEKGLDEKPKLSSLLEETQHKLIYSIYVLVDNKLTSYTFGDVPYKVQKQGETRVTKNAISVADKTNEYSKCYKSEGYRVFEHDLSRAVVGINSKDRVEIKFSRPVQTYMTTVQLNNRYKGGGSYKSGSHQIQITSSYNLTHKYVWYRHSSFHNLIGGPFKLDFNGQVLTLDGDLADFAYNTYLFVYFKTGEEFFRFHLIVFPSKDEKKIKYMTYGEFKEKLNNKTGLKLSALTEVEASTKIVYEPSGNGQIIDPKIKSLLDIEQDKLYNISILLDKQTKVNYPSSKSITIDVSEKNVDGTGDFKMFEHKFSKPVLNDIILFNNNYYKILDITHTFNAVEITHLTAYFNKNNLQTPLIIGLHSNSNVKRYFKFSEIFNETHVTVKLEDLTIINEPIKAQIEDQYKKLTTDLTFLLNSKKDYGIVKVTEGNLIGNFKHYLHISKDPFNTAKIEATNCQFDSHKSSDFKYLKLIVASAFYHELDENNVCPLLIEMFIVVLEPASKENPTDLEYKNKFVSKYDSVFFELTSIEDNTGGDSSKWTKKYSTTNFSELFVFKLESIYNKDALKTKIDKMLNIHSPNFVSTLTYQPNHNKLYIYSYSDDTRALIICYRDKAYKRYYVGENTSRWVRVDSIKKCLCALGQFDEPLLTNLTAIAKLLGLIIPVQIIEEETVETTKLPERPEKTESPLQIDLSRTGPSYYGDPSISVSTKHVYDGSNSFFYYTHSLKSKATFKLSSFTLNNQGHKTVNLDKKLQDVKSVDVYFNIFNESVPVLLIINIENVRSKFYKGLNKKDSTFTISEDLTIDKDSNLSDKLIDENDAINGTVTYQIEKIPDSDIYSNYGLQSSIMISQEEQYDDFISYRHSATTDNNLAGYVFYKKSIVKVLEEGDSVVSAGKPIKLGEEASELIVYYSKTDSRKKNPLLIAVGTYQKTNDFYRLISTTAGDYRWQKIKDTDGLHDSYPFTKLIKLLNSINYHINSSIIIELDKGINTKYDMRIIENKAGNDGQPITSDYKHGKSVVPKLQISVTKSTTLKESKSQWNTGFKFYKHELSATKRLIGGHGNTDKNDIFGLRLYTSSNINSTPHAEIELYDSNNPGTRKRMFLYYKPGETTESGGFNPDEDVKLDVYVYGDDPRPLLFCYKGDTFRRIHNDKNIEWYKDETIKCSDDVKLLRGLDDIYKSMKKKVIFLKQGKYENINKTTETKFGKFVKDSYTPKVDLRNPNGPFNLPKNHLLSQIQTGSNIDKLLDELDGNTFDHINVYKNKNESSLQHTLLFEFINESNKTHFQRVDLDAKYWSTDEFQYSTEKELQERLPTLQSNIDSTIIYEIERTTQYNSIITLQTKQQQPTDGFTTYVHVPQSTVGKTKSMVLFNGVGLKFRYSESDYRVLEIEKHVYFSVTTYFSKNFKDFPLIIELTKSADEFKSFYRRCMYDSVLFWEPLEVYSGFSGSEQLIVKLKEIELDLTESIIILIQKQSHYGSYVINNAVGKLDPRKDIPIVNVGREGIKVNDVTHRYGSCIQSAGFKIFEHNLDSIVTSGTNYGLRLLISTNSGTHYHELNLSKTGVVGNTHLYHKQGTGASLLYVYYYGSDPRPLLVWCHDSAYIPSSISEYDTKWVQARDIGKFSCENYDSENLLKTLSDMVGILNELKLDQRPYSLTEQDQPNTHGTTITYSLQTFDGTEFKAKVSYENQTCYRVYVHKPYGTKDNGSGYRLGNLTFRGSSGISYDLKQQLESVSIYYHLYDYSHTHPLLIKLGFNGAKNDYYKLNDFRQTKWSKMENHGDDKDFLDKVKHLTGPESQQQLQDSIESKIFDIRKKLGLKFENTEHTRPLFNPHLCREYYADNTDVIIKATSGTVGTLAVVGTGTGVALAKFPEVLIPVIKALT